MLSTTPTLKDYHNTRIYPVGPTNKINIKYRECVFREFCESNEIKAFFLSNMRKNRIFATYSLFKIHSLYYSSGWILLLSDLPLGIYIYPLTSGNVLYYFPTWRKKKLFKYCYKLSTFKRCEYMIYSYV